MQADNITKCQTAREFVEVLDPSSDFWTIGGGDWRLDWIFRGQAEFSGRRLIPKAFRQDGENPGKDMKFARDRAITRGVSDLHSVRAQKELVDLYGENNVGSWMLQLYAEITNMRDYIGFAKTVKFDIVWPDLSDFPTFGTRFVKLYGTKLDDQNYMAQLWGKPAFAVGQHHGLSTRLLDWTRNPLFAAFFAINNLSKEDVDNISEIAVYAIHDLLSGGRFRIIEVDRSVSLYIEAQDGLFTLDTLADQDFLKNGKWRSLDEAYEGDIHKVTLPASEVGELVRILWRKKITIAHMMPVVDNILTALTNKWRWQYPDMTALD